MDTSQPEACASMFLMAYLLIFMPIYWSFGLLSGLGACGLIYAAALPIHMQKDQATLADETPPYPSAQYRLVIGSRLSRPNALGVIFTPGGAWRRLYSLRSTMRATRLTIAAS